MSESAHCLSLVEIEQLSGGATVDAERAGHLRDCSACRDRLESARRDARLIREVAAATRGQRQREGPADIVPGYELLNEIHRGGQGIVYRALHRETKRIVALKLPLSGEMRSASQQRRFEREIELVAQLNHPNIVTLFDAGKTAAGVPGYAMEYVEGRPLDRHVRERLLQGRTQPRGRDEVSDIVRLISVVTAAVAYAHQRGVIHRDLKPANILIDDAGAPHILDFGLGRGLTPGRTLTLDGEFAGTLDYAAPEQFGGASDAIDLRCDIYSIGVMLYELLTGSSPRSREGNLLEQIQRITSSEAAAASRVNPVLDAGVEAIVMRCLRTAPDERYASAAALQADLENYLHDRPLEARADSGWYRLTVVARRHRWLLASLATAFVFLSAIAIAMTILYRRADHSLRMSEDALASARLEQARLQVATGRIPTAEDGLWRALLRSESPVGVAHTDPVFWALIELYANHPCRRTWHHPANAILRRMAFESDRSFMSVSRGGQFRRFHVDRDAPLSDWSAGLPTGVFFAAPVAGSNLYFGTDLVEFWSVEPDVRRVDKLATETPIGAYAAGLDLGIRCEVQGDRIVLTPLTAGALIDAARCICIHPANVRAVHISANGLMISGDSTGRLICSDITQDPPLIRWEARDWEPGGGLRASLASDLIAYQQRQHSRLAFARLGSGERVGISVRDRVSRLIDCDFDPLGESAFVTHNNETALFHYRVADGLLVRTLLGHRDRAQQVAISPDGRMLLSGTEFSELKLWDIAADSPGELIRVLAGSILSIAFSPDGRSLLAGYDGLMSPNDTAGAVIIDVAAGRVVRKIELADSVTMRAAWCADGQRFVSVDRAGVLHVWDSHTGQLQRKTSAGVEMQSMRTIPGSDWVAAACYDGTPRLYNAATGELRKLPAQGARVASIAVSPDGRTAAYCGVAKYLTVCDLASGRVVHETPSSPDILRSLAFSADGRLLAVTGNDARVRVYRTSDWQIEREIAVLQQPIFGLAFRPDGKVLATGDTGGTILLWDLATGTNLIKLNRHSSSVFNLAYSPDGRVLASGGQDCRLILHDLSYYEQHVAGNLEAALSRDPDASTTPRAHALRAWARGVR